MASAAVEAAPDPAKGKSMSKSKSMPTRLLDSTGAFKASVDMPPTYTIRKKIVDPADKEKRPGCQTYDIGKCSRNGVMKMPSWSMAPRASGIPKPPMVPGPGQYPLPGSIYGEHPCIEQPGRVPKTTTKRVDPQDWEPKDTPSPQDYHTQQKDTFGRVDQASAPKFTIRKKFGDPADREKRPGCQTYEIKNLGRKGPMTAPCWSMAARSSGIPPPNGFPAPGDYPQPGSIYGSHPTIPQPGRVPKRTEKRTDPADWEPRDTPGPDHYKVEPDPGEFGHYANLTEPKFSIRKKIADPADKEKRPGCQTYDIGNSSRKGAMTAPKWSMAARSSGIPAPPKVPGPGEYPLPGSIYGSHPCIEQPGRVPKTTTKRTEPSEWEPKDTPSPQDYAVVQEGNFGRVDQASAPKFTIRQKITDPVSKEKRPGCQTYDIKNMARKGAMQAPSWSMAARSAGIPPPPKVPGPGEYAIPGSIYGSHPCIDQPGRVPKVTAKRFDDDPEERPY